MSFGDTASQGYKSCLFMPSRCMKVKNITENCEKVAEEGRVWTGAMAKTQAGHNDGRALRYPCGQALNAAILRRYRKLQYYRILKKKNVFANHCGNQKNDTLMAKLCLEILYSSFRRWRT